METVINALKKNEKLNELLKEGLNLTSILMMIDYLLK